MFPLFFQSSACIAWISQSRALHLGLPSWAHFKGYEWVWMRVWNTQTQWRNDPQLLYHPSIYVLFKWFKWPSSNLASAVPVLVRGGIDAPHSATRMELAVEVHRQLGIRVLFQIPKRWPSHRMGKKENIVLYGRTYWDNSKPVTRLLEGSLASGCHAS